MIRNIVFDIGKVLVDYDWDTFFMKRFGNDRALVDRVEQALFGGKIWNEVDRGAIGNEELVKTFLSRDPEISGAILKAWGCIGEGVSRFPGTLPWIRDLKKRGYRVYFLSNWSYHLLDQCRETLSFKEEMDGGVFSCLVRLIKPDPEIYRLLLKKYGLKAEECVFLDDREDNVEAARALGFSGIVVRDQAQAGSDLQKLLKE